MPHKCYFLKLESTSFLCLHFNPSRETIPRWNRFSLGIDSVESMPGVLKSLTIKALVGHWGMLISWQWLPNAQLHPPSPPPPTLLVVVTLWPICEGELVFKASWRPLNQLEKKGILKGSGSKSYEERPPHILSLNVSKFIFISIPYVWLCTRSHPFMS